jgi:hypothetical protein
MNAPITNYFKDEKVVISSTGATLGVNNFAISNMASVSMVEKKRSRIPWIILALVGLFGGLFFLRYYGYTSFTVYIGLVVFIIGAAMAIFQKNKFIIRVVSSGIAIDGLETTDRKYAQQIIDAINLALEKRG